jgi:S1-C subfamily serine protease
VRREFAGSWEYLLEDAIFTVPPYLNFGGAALINRDGQLLGIGSLFTQLTVPELGSIPCNLFVPIDLLRPILSDLTAKGRSSEPSRPWLGLNAEEAHGRVFIIRVTPEGPSERAGLQSDDLVLTVKGEAVKGLADFYRKVWALGNAGIDVPLTILRGTQIHNITVPSVDRYQFLRLKPPKIL